MVDPDLPYNIDELRRILLQNDTDLIEIDTQYLGVVSDLIDEWIIDDI
jgi:hypothetical protein